MEVPQESADAAAAPTPTLPPACTPCEAYNALQEGHLVLDARSPRAFSLLGAQLAGAAAALEEPDSLRGAVIVGEGAAAAAACAQALARWPALAPVLRLLPAADAPALAAAFPWAVEPGASFGGPFPAALGDGVFLGSAWHAGSGDCLRACGFTHLVVCMREAGGCSAAAAAELGLRVARFPWVDAEGHALLQDLPAAVAAVEAGRRARGGRVLVHCWAGASRSAAAAAAWLLWRRGGTVAGAHAALRAARSAVGINAGFLAQLEVWRECVAAAGGCGCDLGSVVVPPAWGAGGARAGLEE